MTIVQKEIKTIYSIRLNEEEIREALSKSRLIDQKEQEDFMKHFKNILYRGENQLRTRALEDIVRTLEFDGIVNFGFWDNAKNEYRMTVYNWGQDNRD